MVRLAVCLDPVRLDAVCLYAEIRPAFRTYSVNVLRLAVCLDLSGCSASVCCLSLCCLSVCCVRLRRSSIGLGWSWAFSGDLRRYRAALVAMLMHK